MIVFNVSQLLRVASFYYIVASIFFFRGCFKDFSLNVLVVVPEHGGDAEDTYWKYNEKR